MTILRRAAEVGVAVLQAILLPACGGTGSRGAAARPVAAATIAPLASLVAGVAGDGWEVRTIVPPGTSAHVFEPRPSDVEKLAPARLVVMVGAGYDTWIARMASSGASRAVLHDAAASVGVRAAAGGDGHSHGGHGDGDLDEDPHWWLSPPLAARALPGIARAFGDLDPPGREGYDARARALGERIGEMDRELAGELSGWRGKSFVSTHAGWRHFAARYGIVAGEVVEPAPGRDPSPAQIRRLIDSARREGLGVLFTEPQFPERAARIIARDGGLTLVLVDPIGGVPGRADYLETMRWNGRRFAEGLAARPAAGRGHG